MFFGSRNNLIKPGPSLSMADGWETRRRRGPGNDWALIRLAQTGTIERLELDTSHFKGNAPARCVVEAIAPRPADEGSAMSTPDDWRVVLASPLQPHTRHVFEHELRRVGPVSHLQLSVFPCGGIARLRAWGELAPVATADAVGVARLNAMGPEEATGALRRCCGSTRWARPDGARRGRSRTPPRCCAIAERLWWALDRGRSPRGVRGAPEDRRARRPHDAATAAWSTAEQRAAAAADATLAELADANRAYAEQFGFIYIVCATGRSADTMLADVRARLRNTRAEELRTASEEQAKILRLRLTKLVEEAR